MYQFVVILKFSYSTVNVIIIILLSMSNDDGHITTKVQWILACNMQHACPHDSCTNIYIIYQMHYVHICSLCL